MFVEQLSQAIVLFGLGMGTVFTLLALLIACVASLSAISRRFAPSVDGVSDADMQSISPINKQNLVIGSPLSAQIIEVCVGQGDSVEKGDVVVRLEAMKMETTILAHGPGYVTELHAKKGDNVDANQAILALQCLDADSENVLNQTRNPQSSSKQGAMIESPLSANVIEICVGLGDSVDEGDVVMRLEAMKMETDVLADGSGKVSQLFAKEGDSVDSGQAILALV